MNALFLAHYEVKLVQWKSPPIQKINELRQRKAAILKGGGSKRIERQHAQGKLTARERIQQLLDEGSFHEMEPFNLSRFTPEDKMYGDGVITGFGTIDKRLVYLYAQDFTVYGGTMSEMQSRKICRMMDLAFENKAPVISLIDSGGARIQEGIISLAGYAGVFLRTTRLSGLVPQISLILGLVPAEQLMLLRRPISSL